MTDSECKLTVDLCVTVMINGCAVDFKHTISETLDPRTIMAFIGEEVAEQIETLWSGALSAAEQS